MTRSPATHFGEPRSAEPRPPRPRPAAPAPYRPPPARSPAPLPDTGDGPRPRPSRPSRPSRSKLPSSPSLPSSSSRPLPLRDTGDPPRPSLPSPLGPSFPSRSSPPSTTASTISHCSPFASFPTTNRSLGSTTDTTTPGRPARPVRPARWTKWGALLGSSRLKTASTAAGGDRVGDGVWHSLRQRRKGQAVATADTHAPPRNSSAPASPASITWQVESACRHVRHHQHARVPIAEAVQHRFALLLAHLPVQACHAGEKGRERMQGWAGELEAAAGPCPRPCHGTPPLTASPAPRA